MPRTLVGEEAITLRTFATGARGTDGRYTAGASVDTPIQASVQPLNGRDLQTLEEGDRQKDTKKFYTLASVKTADQHTGDSADHLIVDGISYEARKVQRWRPNAPLPHFKVIGVRVQE